ncbi:ARHGB factor, partial [Irena cyanogastra]|nr:ARHGB factor [Irena cyanogastra]
AQEEGPEEATPPRGCSQSEPELWEGGGASAEGNFFYLSLPSGPPRPGGDVGDTPRDSRDPPGDTELILGTLEELRGKLLRLRALEAAHRQLLRSMGGGDATVPSGVPNSVPSNVPNGVPGDVPRVPSDVPSVPSVPSTVPGRAPPPPSPQGASRAPRGPG